MEAPKHENRPEKSELDTERIAYVQKMEDEEHAERAIAGFFMWHGVYLNDVDIYAHDINTSDEIIYKKISEKRNGVIENFSETTRLVNKASDSPSQALQTTADILSREHIARGKAFDKLRPIKSFNPDDYTPDFFSGQLIELSRAYPDPAERHAKLVERYGQDLESSSDQIVQDLRSNKRLVRKAQREVTKNAILHEDYVQLAKNVAETAGEVAGGLALGVRFVASICIESLRYKIQQRRRQR